MSDAAILRISEKQTMELIRLYKEEEYLWKPGHEDYRDRARRKLATEKIAKALNIPHFTERHVLTKFKNIRNAYSQELKRIARSIEIGKTYEPIVFWFKYIHSFLRPYIQTRNNTPSGNKSENIMVWHEDDTETWVTIKREHDLSNDYDTDIGQEAEITNNSSDYNEPKKIKLEDASSDPKMTKMFTLSDQNAEGNSNAEESSLSLIDKSTIEGGVNFIGQSIRKHIDEQQSQRNTIVSAIKDLSKTIESMKPPVEDVFDCFGKYVAVLLKTLPQKKAISIQPHIISLITAARSEDIIDDK